MSVSPSAGIDGAAVHAALPETELLSALVPIKLLPAALPAMPSKAALLEWPETLPLLQNKAARRKAHCRTHAEISAVVPSLVLDPIWEESLKSRPSPRMVSREPG